MVQRGLCVHSSLLITVITFTILISGCTAPYTVKHPEIGVTKQILPGNKGKQYDFSKLQKGYGLYVFSYEFTGMEGSEVFGSGVKVIEGTRVWEQQFEKGEWEIFEDVRAIPLWGSKDFYFTYEPTRRTSCFVQVRFHQGRIVYGGRLVADLREGLENLEIEMHFEEDCRPILDAYGAELDGVIVDTIPMELLPLRVTR